MGTKALSARIIEYFSGQGNLLIGPDGGKQSLTDVNAEAFRWLGNVSSVSYTPTEERTQHKESHSGIRSNDRTIVTARSIPGSFVVEDPHPENWALLNIGDVIDVATGAVVDEPIGNPGVDEIIKLDFEGITNLVIKDSATVPDTWTNEVNYHLEAGSGLVRILDKTTGGPFVPPYFASYTKADRKRVSLMTRESETLYSLIFDGLNTQEADGSGNLLNIMLMLYSVVILPGQEIPLIGDGIQGFTLNFEARLDPTKAADADLGQFGYLSRTVPTEEV